jgi:hypothetical protein
MAASASNRVKATDGDGWVAVASGADQLHAAGKVERGGGMIYYGDVAPTAASLGTSMRTGESFSYELAAADGVWIKTGDLMVVSVQKRES